MNEETRRLQELLERATAPGNQMSDDLDAETSSLREGWLALSKLLEDARVAPDQPLDRWQVTLRPAAQRRWFAVAAALAASLLIAAGLTLAYRLLERSDIMAPSAPRLAQDGRPLAEPLAVAPEAVAKTTNADARSSVADGLTWDDPLDDEITAVAQAAAWVQQDWYAQTGGLGAIERGLDQIQKDIEDGTL